MVSDSIDIYVGKRIRRRRKQLGISQQKVAKSIGRTFQQLQKYETGKNRISASILYKLSQALRCTVLWFYQDLGEDNNSTAGPTRQEILIEQEISSLINHYAALPEEQRKSIRILAYACSELRRKFKN